MNVFFRFFSVIAIDVDCLTNCPTEIRTTARLTWKRTRISIAMPPCKHSTSPPTPHQSAFLTVSVGLRQHPSPPAHPSPLQTGSSFPSSMPTAMPSDNNPTLRTGSRKRQRHRPVTPILLSLLYEHTSSLWLPGVVKDGGGSVGRGWGEG